MRCLIGKNHHVKERGNAAFALPGGVSRVRTGDPLLAKQVLSH